MYGYLSSLRFSSSRLWKLTLALYVVIVQQLYSKSIFNERTATTSQCILAAAAGNNLILVGAKGNSGYLCIEIGPNRKFFSNFHLPASCSCHPWPQSRPLSSSRTRSFALAC